MIFRFLRFVVFGFVISSCNSLFYHPDDIERLTPEKFQFEYHDLAIQTSDGAILHAWHIPTKLPRIGTVVHFHGNGQNLTAHYAFSYWLPLQGFDLVVFDYEGYGSSTGKPNREATIENGIAVLNFVNDTIDHQNIFVLGQSLGGAVGFVSVAKAKLSSVKALALESTFGSYRQLTQAKLAGNFITYLFQWPFKFLISDEESPRDYLDQVSIPVICFHGTNDSVVPFEIGKEFCESIKSQNLNFVPIEGGGHTPAFTRKEITYKEMLVDFFEKSSKAEPSKLLIDHESDQNRKKAMTEAKKLNLAESINWQKLLFYNPKWLSKKKSMVASPSFFVSPDGKENPQAELDELLTMMFDPKLYEKYPNPLCRYRSRYEWLQEQLNLYPPNLPKLECPESDAWLEMLQPVGISYVFSSYYLNNPASLFGHVFLRVHLKKGYGSPLLDLGGSFMAYPDTNNALMYPLKGLFGRFPGRYGLDPYYMKVQEYNNSERRDLWEYELNVSPKGLRQILLSMYEMKDSYINYYYFDDNCGLLVLKLLEIGFPEMDESSKLHSWVTPNEALQAVVNYPGLMKKVTFRPSNFRVFLSRLNHLSSEDKSQLEELLKSQNIEIIKNLQLENSKAKIIDAALDFIDYDEKLAGSKQAEKWQNFRPILLTIRSHLQELPLEVSSSPPEREFPNRATPPSRIGLTARNGFLELNWRPALHDLASPSQGFGEELEINFFDTSFHYDLENKHHFLANFKLLEITSIPENQAFINPLSWELLLATVSFDEGHNYFTYLELGVGKSFLLANHLRFFGLFLSDLGHSTKNGFRFGPGIRSGLIWNMLDSLTFSSQAKYVWLYPQPEELIVELQNNLSYAANPKLEFRLSFVREQLINSLGLGGFYYF